MGPKGTGAYVSPPDYRDAIASVAAVKAIDALPMSYHVDLGDVLDQNKIPACVSHSVVYLMRRYFYKKTGKWIKLSPRFLDIMAKRMDGQDRETGGTWPRLVLKIAQQYGCATEDVLPNNTELPTLSYRDDHLITDTVLANAAQYKIPGYVQIATDPVSTKNGIFLFDTLSSLFVIGDEFWTPSWEPKDIDPIRTPANPVSGHELSPCGWSTFGSHIGRNEWSLLWDIAGEFHYDPQAWQPWIHEQWAVAEVPSDVVDFLKNLPSPSDFHFNWIRDLHRGDVNDEVGMAQVAFMILGYMQPVMPDEFRHYGPKTAQAVYAFQTANGIGPVAGSIGPATRKLLNIKFA